ncbi:MAG: hypothetical protein U0794_12955 [Isosphaeraceae bacterium]
MSGNNSQGAGGTASITNPFLDLWTKYLEQSGSHSKAMFDGLQSIADPQKLQQKWLDIMAENLDRFMRTPAFLESMKQNLKVMTDLKRMQDQAIEDTARHLGAPLASDIHGLFERLNGIEQAILAKLGSIESRLDALESRRKGSGG